MQQRGDTLKIRDRLTGEGRPYGEDDLSNLTEQLQRDNYDVYEGVK